MQYIDIINLTPEYLRRIDSKRTAENICSLPEAPLWGLVQMTKMSWPHRGAFAAYFFLLNGKRLIPGGDGRACK